jgi:hypothetical protein
MPAGLGPRRVVVDGGASWRGKLEGHERWTGMPGLVSVVEVRRQHIFFFTTPGGTPYGAVNWCTYIHSTYYSTVHTSIVGLVERLGTILSGYTQIPLCSSLLKVIYS